MPAKLEYRIATGRLAAALVLIGLALLLPSASPTAVGIAATILIAASGLAIYLRANDAVRLAGMTTRVAMFAVEVVAAGLVLAAFSWPGYVTWGMFLLVVVTGAIRWGAAGSLAAYVAFVVATAAVVLWHPVAAPTLSQAQFVLGSTAFEFAVMGVAAAFFGQATRSARLSRARLDALQSEVDSRTRVLRDSEGRFGLILDTLADGIVTLDERGTIGSANPAAQQLFGYSREQLVGQDIRLLLGDTNGSRFTEFLTSYLQSEAPDRAQINLKEATGRRRDGSLFPLEFRPEMLPTGSGRLYVCNLRDISERQAHLAALEHQAMHDALTGLANRALFRDRLKIGIAQARRSSHSLSLLLVDLNEFKEVNDTLGHHNGDLLLQQMARRIQAELRDTDTVARLGGDEFAILAGDHADQSGSRIVAERLIKSMSEPYVIEGNILHLSASMGIAVCPEHGEDPDTLLRHADVAMYHAKRDRIGFAIYAPEQDAHSSDRLRIMSELRNALARDELVLHYQPKISLATGTVVGVEALVRWQHPAEGLLYPDRFIPLAEESELMWPMTEVILVTALRQHRIWLAAGLDFKIAVNLSADTLRDRGLAERIAALLAQEGVPGSALILEITESSLMGDGAEDVLAILRAMDIGLSADDFGTGYSSLARLKRIPLTELKIDKSFVMRMDSDPVDAAIVLPTIDLAHNMGLRVVAEGVEDEATLRMLRGFGCDLAQGFFIARPMPARQLEKWLETSQWAPAHAFPPGVPAIA